MSDTDHSRHAGTHRAGHDLRSYRWDEYGSRRLRRAEARDLKDLKEQVAVVLDGSEPAKVTVDERLVGIAEPLAEWEFELLNGYDTYEAYLDAVELANPPQVEPTSLVYEVDERGHHGGDLRYRWLEPIVDEQVDEGDEAESTFLPVMTLRAFYAEVGDGFQVTGPSSPRPVNRKSDRDEPTVSTLAVRWNVETRDMIAALRAFGEYVNNPSQRVAIAVSKANCPEFADHVLGLPDRKTKHSNTFKSELALSRRCSLWEAP